MANAAYCHLNLPLYMAGAWNRRYGLLFIDQPVGSGFSIAGNACTCGLVTLVFVCLVLLIMNTSVDLVPDW